MGFEIGDREYSARDYEEFNHRIHDQIDTLKKIIDRHKYREQIRKGSTNLV